MLALASRLAAVAGGECRPRVFRRGASAKARVALLDGCVQPVLAPSINEADDPRLNRLGVEVVLAKGEGCCGALVHHMGKATSRSCLAARNIEAWHGEIEGQGLDAILITASGCGTTIKDYGFMLRDDAELAEKAAKVSALAKDICEYLTGLELPAPSRPSGLTVAYHSACSMQHGQKITDEPKRLLRAAGFKVKDVAEGHICCGSAGVYNILQPEIAGKLRDRQGRTYRAHETRHRRHRQHRLHHPDREGLRRSGESRRAGVPADRAYGRALDWALGGPRPAGVADYG